MKIVVLDGYTLNPGDLDWQGLQSLGECAIYDHTLADEVVARCQDAQIVLTNKTVLNAQILSQLSQLKYIGVLATGTNVVDIACASQHGICVTNIPAYGPDAVAQMVFAHILHHHQQVSLHDQAVKAGQWSRNRDFCFTLSPLTSLKGLTLGVVGYGDIGQQVANLGAAFGMKVLVTSAKPKTDLPPAIQWCERDTLLKQADIISLHCPLTAATKYMINRDSLALLKAGCLLVNTARGDLINEADLAQWLNQNNGFAAVDVLSTEPPSPNNPLLSAANITITPHIAWATLQARQNLLNIAVNNIKQFLLEDVVNCVNG
ncbi:D-2-hydroxyacid dehydrogenase [Shewanella inventionis]|uniref:Glycerate dehydrogenase n=1 Tax=Shewanella inventionis TaxID=1738770 RepID=A0ABQ1J718_9GAMM|nr:D-2-hydroxyacid dehydrogenase [Shewanella inventionis]MCL1158695.1 D-2-hydroxyacid dehydrogenase [Shewanella inventionis]UAL42883.1 D-2-hydroxyacid dehydrogenase [Shewanella inventionis]GGB61402.1 glycerate dehydrogenase [Shewanella inventionis]